MYLMFIKIIYSSSKDKYEWPTPNLIHEMFILNPNLFEGNAVIGQNKTRCFVSPDSSRNETKFIICSNKLDSVREEFVRLVHEASFTHTN